MSKKRLLKSSLNQAVSACSCCKCLFTYISLFLRPNTYLFVSRLYNIMINSFPSLTLLIHEPVNVLSFLSLCNTDPIHFIFVLPDRVLSCCLQFRFFYDCTVSVLIFGPL